MSVNSSHLDQFNVTNSNTSFKDAKVVCIWEHHFDEEGKRKTGALISEVSTSFDVLLMEGALRGVPVLSNITNAHRIDIPTYWWDCPETYPVLKTKVLRFIELKERIWLKIASWWQAEELRKLEIEIGQLVYWPRNKSLIDSVRQFCKITQGRVFIIAGAGHFHERYSSEVLDALKRELFIVMHPKSPKNYGYDD